MLTAFSWLPSLASALWGDRCAIVSRRVEQSVRERSGASFVSGGGRIELSGQIAEKLIGVDFFAFGGLQQGYGFFQPQLMRPGFQRPVPRNFVMLDGLRRSRETGVSGLCLAEFSGYFIAFANNALDGLAWGALGLAADHLKHAFEPGDMTLGLREVFFKRVLEVLRMGGFDHLWEGLGYRILGVIRVLQLMLEQFSEVGVQRRILGFRTLG